VIGSFLPIGDCCIGRLDGKSRMSGDVHVRICERVGVRFPRATRLVVLCDGTKEQAEEMRQELKKFLSTELKLTLSMEKTKITHVREGFRFLGFWIERNIGRNGKIAPKIHIPKEAMERFRDKYRRALDKTSHEHSINLKITALNRIIQGWCQYYQTTSSTPAEKFVYHGQAVQVDLCRQAFDVLRCI
jgi:hypothetical protein